MLEEFIFFEHCQFLLSALKTIKQEDRRPDVRVVCAQGAVVRTHSLLLAAASPLMQAVLHSVSPNGSADQEFHIIVPELEARHFTVFVEKLLDSSLTSEIDERALSNVCQLLGAFLSHRKQDLSTTTGNHDSRGLNKVAAPPTYVDTNADKSEKNTTTHILPESNSREIAQDFPRNSVSDVAREEKLLRKNILVPKKNQFHRRTIFQCDHCQRQFDVKRNFLHHINSHLGIKPYSCNLCSKKFTTKSHLNTHIKIHSGNKPYVCHICGKSFAVSSNLKKHSSLHTRNQDEEEAKAAAIPGAESVPLEKSKDSPVLSEAQFEQVVERESLTSSLEAEPKYTLSTAGTQSDIRWEDDDYLAVEDPVECGGAEAGALQPGPALCPKLLCVLCSKEFASNSKLTSHIESHAAEKPHWCKVCGKQYSQKSHLNQHEKVKHSNSGAEEKFSCDVCNKTLAYKSSLTKHKRTHIEDKPFLRCKVCQKRFLTPRELESHAAQHAGNLHLCVECGKSFTTKGHLREHAKVHTGERVVYQCLQCKAQYFGLNDLKVHMRKHSGELPFPCPHCPKRFRSNRNLDNHRRVHTGEKPYQCGGCRKGFTASSGLCQHFKKSPQCQSNAGSKAGAYKPKQQKPIAPLRGQNVQSLQHCVILDTIDLNLSHLTPLVETETESNKSTPSVLYIKQDVYRPQTTEAGDTAAAVDHQRFEAGLTLPPIFLDTNESTF